MAEDDDRSARRDDGKPERGRFDGARPARGATGNRRSDSGPAKGRPASDKPAWKRGDDGDGQSRGGGAGEVRRGRSSDGPRGGSSADTDRRGAPRDNARRPDRDGDQRSASSRGGDQRSASSRDGERRGAPRDAERSGRPSAPGGARSGGPRAGSTGRGVGGPRDQKLWTKGGAPAGGDRSVKDGDPFEDRDPFNTRSVRPRHDDPEIPSDVKSSQLDRVARNELKTLDKENAEGVAEHLVMVARLIDDDPELAHAHALSAARRAGRIGIVRETLAITAYGIGDFALALRELRTYRRITGRDDEIPLMVDSERGLGRPEKALELGRSVPRSSLEKSVQAELAIAMSGARLDLGQPAEALRELEVVGIDPDTAYSWSAPLFAAYATVLEELGRNADAETWWRRADAAAEAFDEPADAEIVEVVEEIWVDEHEHEQGDAVADLTADGPAADGATEPDAGPSVHDVVDRDSDGDGDGDGDGDDARE